MRKTAKVYEASEAVEGMKPKMTFESHKKCTPGEFGMHVKSAMKLRLGTPIEYAAFTGGGAGLGALVGALTARRGKLLRDAMRGGLVGAGAGAGFNLGGNLANGLTYDHVLNHGPLVSGGAGLGALVGAAAVDNALGDEKKEKTAFEKSAIPAFGGRNFSLAPRGAGIGLNAGYDYLGGVVPNPYVGIDIGTPHTGVMLSGPIPGIGFRSGMFSRPPGATSGHNRNGVFGHRSLWKYLADAYSGRDPAEIEDEVHDDRLQSMRNVTKDEFHEAIPDYHEGPKGKPLSKDLHKALTEYYHRNSRPEKQSAVEFGQKVAFNLGSLGLDKIDWNALKHPAIAGAGLGALAGGVHGLINPGTDEKGNTRSRFGAMLRGALGGGAVGGLGGAAAGHFAPKATSDLLNKLRYQYTMHTPVPTQAQTQARQNFQSAGEEPFIENGVMNPAMQAAQG